GALRLGALLEAGRGEHAHATEAVTTRRRAEEHDDVAGSLRAGEHEPLLGQDPETQHVDERVLPVAVVEHDIATHGRNADRVAVAADPRDDALEEVAGARVVERPEPQRAQQRGGPPAHGEVAGDAPADTGRRALVRLHRGRVVVALDPDGDGIAPTDVDDTRTLPRADEHPRRLRREPA